MNSGGKSFAEAERYTREADRRRGGRQAIAKLKARLPNSQMARHAALPPTLPPRLICREAAAAYISVAPGTFDKMVEDGRMPRAKRLSEGRVAWDVRALDAAIDSLPSDGMSVEADNSWNDVDAVQTSAAR